MRMKQIDPQNYLRKSPLFRLSLSSKELFHSNFLEWLSKENREAFRKLINRMADLGENYDWGTQKWYVKREFKNFDLCVVAYDDDETSNHLIKDNDFDYTEEDIADENGLRVLFVIENKVKSIPYKEQLIEYAKKAETINKKTTKKEKAIFVLLTLAQTFPDKPEGQKDWKLTWEEGNKKGECTWRICPYSDYVKLLKEYYLNRHFSIIPKPKGPEYQIIKDYVGFIESLTSLSKSWAMDYLDSMPFLYYTNAGNKVKKFHQNYLIAKQLRIHDLYQKQKFSYLCTDLYKSIKELYDGKFTIFPSNQSGLFKDKFYSDTGKLLNHKDNYICVNYTYLHGEPLLEINIHPSCNSNTVELYYAIQIQGDAYEHGVQVKKIPNVQYSKIAKGKGKGKKDDIAKHVWENVLQLSTNHPDEYYQIIEGWMSYIPNVFGWDKESCRFLSDNITSTDKYNAYNLSDGAYLYQKRTIISDPTIDEVICKMMKDLALVIQGIGTNKKP